MKKIQKKYRDLQGEDLVRIISRVADSQKALDIVALDVRGLSGFADYFVIMGGTSTRHVQGLAGVIDREISSKRSKSADTEGLNEGQWILLDFNDVIVHIFHHEIRAHYDLEGLWHDAPRLDLSQPAPVIKEPSAKITRKKPVAKTVEEAVKKPARKAVKKPAAVPVEPARKAPKRVVARTAAKTTATPASKSTGKTTGRPTSKPGRKPTGGATGRSSGRAAAKVTTTRRRSTGGTKK